MLLAFYIAAFPMLEYVGNFPGLPFGFAWYFAYPLFILLTVYWLIHLSKNQESLRLNQMDTAVFFYLATMGLAAVQGFLKGHDLKILLWDFMPTTFFFGYFIFLYSPLKNKTRMLYDVLLCSAIFVSVQFIYALANYQSLVMLTRVVSEHVHIAQFAIPYTIAILIYSTSRRRKFISAFFLPVIVLATIICQQRSLYASAILTIAILFGIFLYTRREWIRKNMRLFTTYIGIVLLFIIVMGIILQIITEGKFLLTLYARIFIFLNLSRLSADTSWRVRWGEIGNALKGLEHFWFLGKGFGVSQITRFRYVRQIVLDQSYMYYIWKTGVVGLLGFLYMYLMFFKRAISTLRKSITSDERIIIITAVLNTFGMMLIAFANVSLGHFRLMFVWAALFACTEVIARKYE